MKILNLARIVSLALVLALAAGCSKHKNLSKDCAAGQDQMNSFMARSPGFPIQVTADTQFDSQERDAIAATIREWNRAGQSFGENEIFRLQFGEIPLGLRTLDPQQCGSEMGGDRDFYVIREKNQEHWKSIGFFDSTPGATIRCYNDDQSELQRQIIYMNPSLMEGSQFDQAFAHEFGHALGLDHSCSGKEGDPSFLGCDPIKSKFSHPYYQAVMYPMLKPVQRNSTNWTNIIDSLNSEPRVSAVLRSNDLIRGECVVGPTD